MTRRFSCPWFNRPNNIWWRVPIMMIRDTHFSWFLRYFFFLMSNYSFQHGVIKYVYHHPTALYCLRRVLHSHEAEVIRWRDVHMLPLA
jgi:hypothetical protein